MSDEKLKSVHPSSSGSKPNSESGADDASQPDTLAENLKTILYAIVIAVVIRSLFFQPFSIPSGSMLPTLLIGDYLFVSKYSYGYSRHSFPFSPPVLNGRAMSGDVERGDVVVFKLPRDGRTDYIKRVIGLPGDTIQMKQGRLYINDAPVARKPVAPFRQRQMDGTVREIDRYLETLPNGVSYETLDLVPTGRGDNTNVYLVPEAHYFMMGDNRDNSMDSRFSRAVGFVPFENLVGRAEVKFFSFDESGSFFRFWNWPSDIRWQRIFEAVE